MFGHMGPITSLRHYVMDTCCVTSSAPVSSNVCLADRTCLIATIVGSFHLLSSLLYHSSMGSVRRASSSKVVRASVCGVLAAVSEVVHVPDVRFGAYPDDISLASQRVFVRLSRVVQLVLLTICWIAYSVCWLSVIMSEFRSISYAKGMVVSSVGSLVGLPG